MGKREHTTPELGPEYSLVALTDPAWAARLVQEARRMSGERRQVRPAHNER